MCIRDSYSISAHNLNGSSGIVVANTTSNATIFTVENLLPGTTYELIVVAVSQGGNVMAESDPSDSIIDTTGVTGKCEWSSVVCMTCCQPLSGLVCT